MKKSEISRICIKAAAMVAFFMVAGFATEDSLVVETWVAPSQGASLMAPPTLAKSPAGVWNLDGKKSGRAQVAVWFHGGMTSANCSKGLVAGTDLAQMLPNVIVVSASACRENHWVTPTAIGWVDAALDSIASRRGKPVEEVSLVGISDGSLGVVAYSMWGRRSVNHRILMSSYGGNLGPASQIAGESRLHSGSWLFIQGGSDRLYPAEASVPWIQQFCQSVERCELKFDPAGEHDWSYWKARHESWILGVFKEK